MVGFIFGIIILIVGIIAGVCLTQYKETDTVEECIDGQWKRLKKKQDRTKSIVQLFI